MKFFIYKRFWDSFLKLDKTTQVGVTEFISKFRTNPRSAAINLESISSFKDQSLRTARISQKYRAIIKEVEASKVYLLIWVDNHDEAMNWAKNKVIDWNEQTQAFQVFSIEESTGPCFLNRYPHPQQVSLWENMAIVNCWKLECRKP